MNRDKRVKFVDLANSRVNRTLKDIRLIGNLSNRSAYEYTEEDVRKIVRALQREIDVMRGRFGSTGGGGDSDFSCPEQCQSGHSRPAPWRSNPYRGAHEADRSRDPSG